MGVTRRIVSRCRTKPTRSNLEFCRVGPLKPFAAATAAAAAATASAAVVEIPLYDWACFVDSQAATADLASVELLDRFVGVSFLHDHECKTFGPPGIAVGDEVHRLHRPKLGEYAIQFVFRRLKRQISHI